MFTLATILDNPGEPAADTRYRDVDLLRQMGYDGVVIYGSTGLSGLLGPDTPATAEMRQWVGELYEQVESHVADARRAGLDVWLTFDAPSLARELVGSAMTCQGNGAVLCPASYELLEMCAQSLEGLLARISDVEGIVLRLGDNDAHRIPYLTGNDIYSPRCSRCGGMNRVHRLDRFVRFFYELVVGKLGRKLMVRAWNVKPGGLHDRPEVCRQLMNLLPQDERLIFSFKFTQTDFWRYQQWNPSSLECGDRPIVYELECQREFEGKGAVPNYQAGLWRDGMPEMPDPIGLAEAGRRANLVGLWAWVRGGGWGGPYITRDTEMWIDANVAAVPRLAADPTLEPADLADEWIADRLKCRDAGCAGALRQCLLDSPQMCLEAFYIGPFARGRRDPWYPAGNVIEDDQIDAEAAWNVVQNLPAGALDEVVTEKQRAAERVVAAARAARHAAQKIASPLDEELLHSLDYAESLIRTIQDLVAGLVAYRRFRVHGDPAVARAAQQTFERCQSHWNHHQRFANLRGTASAFRSDNLWDFTQQAVEELHV